MFDLKRISMALAAAAIGLAMASGTVAAADLVIGSSTEPSAIDPHFSRTGSNQQIAAHIFDSLADQDVNLQIHPGLAESWQLVDPTTWVVKLRADAKFTDGNPVTSADVIFSMERAKDIPNSPAPFTANVAGIASMKAIDDKTIEFKTKKPMPQFLETAGLLYIVEKAAAEGKSIEDFNSGVAAIGSGPYKFKEWMPGDHLTLVRNDGYWGEKPDYETVTFKFISNDAARVAALRVRRCRSDRRRAAERCCVAESGGRAQDLPGGVHATDLSRPRFQSRYQPVHHRSGRQAAARPIR